MAAELMQGTAVDVVGSKSTYDFFAAFKQLFKESVEYKQSLKEHKKDNKVMKNFESQENYPFSKFNTSRQLILFKDSLKRIMYQDYDHESPRQRQRENNQNRATATPAAGNDQTPEQAAPGGSTGKQRM